MILGLRTIIYPAPDLTTAKEWYASLLGIRPYFDEDFYVGFSVGGYELALDPHASPTDGPRTYWGVDDISSAYQELLNAGATEKEPISDVGDGIKVASVTDIAGNILSIIENPHFKLEDRSSGKGSGK